MNVLSVKLVEMSVNCNSRVRRLFRV